MVELRTRKPILKALIGILSLLCDMCASLHMLCSCQQFQKDACALCSGGGQDALVSGWIFLGQWLDALHHIFTSPSFSSTGLEGELWMHQVLKCYYCFLLLAVRGPEMIYEL